MNDQCAFTSKNLGEAPWPLWPPPGYANGQDSILHILGTTKGSTNRYNCLSNIYSGTVVMYRLFRVVL